MMSFSERFLGPYRRITSSGRFIPEIDGLRFFAIFSVFIYHLAGDVLRYGSPANASGLLFRVTQVLNVGVPLFFVISGFILSEPFWASYQGEGRPVRLRKYFLRRLTRLEPPYIAALLLFYMLKVAAGRGMAWQLLPKLFASVFYVHNAVFGRPSDINIVAWSLEIEVQFYLLAPAFALIFRVQSAGIRRIALGLSLLVTTWVSRLVQDSGALQHSLLGYAQYFVAGFVLAELYSVYGRRRQNDWKWDCISVLGWPVLVGLLLLGEYWVEWIMPWLIMLLYIAAFHGKWMNRFVANLWITTIGGMCYSIYLLHNYAIAAVGRVTEQIGSGGSFAFSLAIQFLLITPPVLVICALYFRAIERPCMRPAWYRDLGAFLVRVKERWSVVPARAAVERDADVSE